MFRFLQKLDQILRYLYFFFCQIKYCGPNQDRHILCTLFVLHLLCSHGALCSRSVRQLTAHLVRILSITFTRALKNNWTMGSYFVYFMSWLSQIYTVWTVNDVLSQFIPLDLSQSIPFWVDPYPFEKKGVDRLKTSLTVHTVWTLII